MNTYAPGPVDGAALYALSDAFAAVSAVTAANELGVLDRLRSGHVSVSGLARECAISERGAAVLLSALAGLGLVASCGDGGYAPTAVTAAQVHLAWLRDYWRRLTPSLREGRPVVAAETPDDAQAFYPPVVPMIADLVAPAAEHLAMHLDAPPRNVLDVGAGAAPWSLALTRRFTECRVTALDLPPVLAVTQRAVAKAACVEQFTFRAGDLFTMDLGGAYDLAIAGNLCHLFDETANRRLLNRLSDALGPGGRVAIVDVLLQERLDGPRDAVLYALGLFLRTGSGRIYPFSTYVQWLHEAGFQQIERTDLSGTPPLSLISAWRP